jgi:hypothetical protein
MGIEVRSRWRLLTLVVGLALLVLTVPAQAITPTFVGGNSDCGTVASAGTSSFTLLDPIRDGSFSPESGVTLTLTDVTRTSFSFSISGGEVYDVLVKGSGSNWYDYDGNGGPVTADTGLIIPNGNKLNAIHFCYLPGVDFPDNCVVVVSEEGEDATATFTRTSGDCNDGKRVIIGVENDVITFIPTGGDPNSTYEGTIIFTKNSNDSTALVLQYDPDGDGVAGFRVVPDCGGTDESPTLPNPNPNGDSWCVNFASAVHNSTDTLGIASWTFTWDVYGEGDPLFK